MVTKNVGAIADSETTGSRNCEFQSKEEVPKGFLSQVTVPVRPSTVEKAGPKRNTRLFFCWNLLEPGLLDRTGPENPFGFMKTYGKAGQAFYHKS
jgi:hypothetical protein